MSVSLIATEQNSAFGASSTTSTNVTLNVLKGDVVVGVFASAIATGDSNPTIGWSGTAEYDIVDSYSASPAGLFDYQFDFQVLIINKSGTLASTMTVTDYTRSLQHYESQYRSTLGYFYYFGQRGVKTTTNNANHTLRALTGSSSNAFNVVGLMGYDLGGIFTASGWDNWTEQVDDFFIDVFNGLAYNTTNGAVTTDTINFTTAVDRMSSKICMLYEGAAPATRRIFIT